jgi:hypothetical protein
LAHQPPLVGPRTAAERQFFAAGVSEYRVFFMDHTLPAMHPLRVTAPEFGRTKELARARGLCYCL